jgi:hypothetical protein
MTQLLFLISAAFNILCGLYLLHEGAQLRKINKILSGLCESMAKWTP